VRPHRLIFAACALLVAAHLAGCSGAKDDAQSGPPPSDRDRVPVSAAAPDTGSDPMIVALVDAFTSRSPNARRVSIVEFRREGRGGGANLVLARGVRPDGRFEGRAEDDLFGVFVFDDSLKRVRRTVAMFPSPRFGDTHMEFERTTPDSVFLVGWAEASGETLLTAGYRWSGPATLP
jgi:hypothetical protein